MTGTCKACGEIITAATIGVREGILLKPEESDALAVQNLVILENLMSQHVQARHPELIASISQMSQQYGLALIANLMNTNDPTLEQAHEQQLTMAFYTLRARLQVTKAKIPHNGRPPAR